MVLLSLEPESQNTNLPSQRAGTQHYRQAPLQNLGVGVGDVFQLEVEQVTAKSSARWLGAWGEAHARGKSRKSMQSGWVFNKDGGSGPEESKLTSDD